MAVKSYVDDDDEDDENDGRMAKRSTTTNANERINGIYGDAKRRDPSRVVASSLPYRLFPRLIRQSMVCEKYGRVEEKNNGEAKHDRSVMGRSSKHIVKRTEMSAHGDNATVRQPPYYFRHSTVELAKKPQDDPVTPKENADGEPSIIIASSSSKRRCKYCTYWFAGMLVISMCIIISKILFPYPLHASCIVKWKFGDPCTYVMQKFRCQIMNWSSWNVCQQRGGSCLYTLKVPAEENVIRATHRTSNSKSLEKINIIFEETNNTCLVTADSISNEWFVIFDYGANYCNLHNLVVGAGLDRYTKFLELTSDAMCTQFNMAVCG